eukprot:jgi/Mesvir1/12959/Mv26284-RA.1
MIAKAGTRQRRRHKDASSKATHRCMRKTGRVIPVVHVWCLKPCCVPQAMLRASSKPTLLLTIPRCTLRYDRLTHSLGHK